MAKIRKSFEYILDEGLTVEQAKSAFEIAKILVVNENHRNNLTDMFNFAINNDTSLFTVLLFEEGNLENMAIEYLTKWSNSYELGRTNLAIKRPLKNYGEKDAALTKRIASNTEEDDETLNKYLLGHYLYMSAENMNGAILEEYLAEVLEPYGWIWCAGSTFRAIDFCYFGEKNILLQVKNKYNTENSSSSAIRNGTEIKKWQRLNRPRVATGLNNPIPNWEALRVLVQADENLKLQLTEEKYLEYIMENSTKEIETLN
ncbi:SinI family restriction endonuclease [Lysinibacillus varians]|uniref:SinI family restriction endonuclease n=1 Tax=Lysinibacillus varians TaxID=1145276 RepID=A0ABY2TEC8_9BACI|nr:SinI family restriction endonuclease [Lysinibacillus varians]AHN23121.1 type II restriction endonuclease SinI [Lysinibacillus varians]TKI66469.1 SinI family restriction endonuclease [Lysinibacillus varians]